METYIHINIATVSINPLFATGVSDDTLNNFENELINLRTDKKSRIQGDIFLFVHIIQDETLYEKSNPENHRTSDNIDHSIYEQMMYYSYFRSVHDKCLILNLKQVTCSDDQTSIRRGSDVEQENLKEFEVVSVLSLFHESEKDTMEFTAEQVKEIYEYSFDLIHKKETYKNRFFLTFQYNHQTGTIQRNHIDYTNPEIASSVIWGPHITLTFGDIPNIHYFAIDIPFENTIAQNQYTIK